METIELNLETGRVAELLSMGPQIVDGYPTYFIITGMTDLVSLCFDCTAKRWEGELQDAKNCHAVILGQYDERITCSQCGKELDEDVSSYDENWEDELWSPHPLAPQE